jgi:putative copper export protein
LIGGAVLILAGLGRLYAQSYALNGTGRGLSLAGVQSIVAGTVWGWGWLIQMAGALVLIAAFRRARRGGSGWLVAASASLLIAITPALSGHAVSTAHLVPLTVASDTLHVVGAGTWLGTLAVIMVAGIPAARSLGDEDRHVAIGQVVRDFSRVALVGVGLTTITGVVSAWIHLGSIANLWQSPYGRILLLKVGVFSMVALTGAYNWRRVTPALGNPAGTARLRRFAAFELAIALIIILITAVLAATPTPSDL